MQKMRHILSPFSGPLTLQQRMSILVTILVIFQLGLIGTIFSQSIATMLEEQIGKRALRVSQAVSQIPEIRHGLAGGDPEGRIQSIAEGIRQLTGAEFVVVGDREGRRYSHPKPDRLGKFMVGGDNAPALEEGRSYVSKAVGTLGPSIRGKTPVLDDSGSIEGIVSVGYLMEDVKGIIRGHQRRFYPFIGLLLVVGIVGSVVIAGHFKRAILGLEPEEIANLFTERSAMLESIREGIIAIDTEGTITMANRASLESLGFDSADQITGRRIEDIFPYTGMRDVLNTGRPILDRELTIDGREMIFNMLPTTHRERISGVVATFRLKDEIDLLAQELSHVREYSEMLRTQTHEYSNKLHTLAGLVQIGANKEALDLVSRETSGYQKMIQILSSAVPDPVLSAIVLGKYNRAQEMKVRLSVDEESSLSDIPPGIGQDKVITILGNLLDNALEASLEVDDRERRVHLSMTDLGNDIIIEVEDSGPGIEEGNEDNIFERGVTTKNGSHGGVGLYLVKQALENLGGHITIGESDLGGVLFTVVIPKERRQ